MENRLQAQTEKVKQSEKKQFGVVTKTANIFLETLDMLKRKGEKFYDKDFPPDKSSLMMDWNAKDPHTREY